MKCVIFAAGKGTRLRPLTENIPKPMVEVGGMPILERTLRALPASVEDVIVVVGYLRERIQNYFGANFQNRKIRYAHQREQLGTFHALATARHFLAEDPFLVVSGDDIYHKNDIRRLANHDRAMLAEKRSDVERFGVCEVDERNHLLNIREKPKDMTNGEHFVYTGACMLTPEIFNEEIVYSEKTGEQLLPSTMANMSRKHPITMVEASFWHPIAYPEDIRQYENQHEA